MPRRSSGGSGRASAPPTRPSVPTRPAPQPQARNASTLARPPTPAAQQPTHQSPGLFSQMASTAAGVAVGSSLGHAIGGFFGGSGSGAAPEAAPAQQAAAAAEHAYGMTTGSAGGTAGARVCEPQVANFRSCLDENAGNLTVCGWYLDQLKACQAASGQY